MCRLTAIVSVKDVVPLEDIVTKPKLSIIYQSFNCQERIPRDRPRWAYEQSSLNGDGFGVGWYVPKKVENEIVFKSRSPCVFTSLKPAWSDRNLRNLAEKITSHLIFAHIRAAGPGSGMSTEANCQPFTCGRFMFMHNGTLGQWKRIRRELISQLKTQLAFDFAMEQTPIDSAVLFALFLDQLEHGVEGDYSPNELRLKLEHMISQVFEVCDRCKVEEVSYLNCVLSDGNNLLGTRYALGPYSKRHEQQTTTPFLSEIASSSEDAPSSFEGSILNGIISSSGTSNNNNNNNVPSLPGLPITGTEIDRTQSLSLYYATGTRWTRESEAGDYKMIHMDKRNEVCIISSEPLTEVREEWVPVPHNHLIVVTSKCDVLMQPLSIESRDSTINNFDTTNNNTVNIDTNNNINGCGLDILSVRPRKTRYNNNNNNNNRNKMIPSSIYQSLKSLESTAIDIPPSRYVTGKSMSISSQPDSPRDDPLQRRRSTRLNNNNNNNNSELWSDKADSNGIDNNNKEFLPVVLCRRAMTSPSGPRSSVLSLAVVRIGYERTILFTGDSQGRIDVWDIGMSLCLASLTGHKGGVLSVVQFKEAEGTSHWLFTGSSDATVCLWNVQKILNDYNDSNQLPKATIYGPVSDYMVCRLYFEPLQGDVLSLAIHNLSRQNDEFIFFGFQSNAIGLLKLKSLFDRLRTCSYFTNDGDCLCRSNGRIKTNEPDEDVKSCCSLSPFITYDHFGVPQLVLNASNESAAAPGEYDDAVYPTTMAAAQAQCLGLNHQQPQNHRYISGLPPINTLLPNLSSNTTNINHSRRQCLLHNRRTENHEQDSLEWLLLKSTTKSLQHHCGFVETLCVVDENYLVSGGGDGLLLVWKHAKHIATMTGHTGGVLCLATHPDRRTLYSGSRDKTIRVWDLTSSFGCKQVLRGHTGEVMALIATDLYLISSSSTQQILGWSLRWSEVCFILECNTFSNLPPRHSIITALVTLQYDSQQQQQHHHHDHNTGTQLIGAGSDGIIRFWDVPLELNTRQSIVDTSVVNDFCFTSANLTGDNTICKDVAETFDASQSLCLKSILSTLVRWRTVSGQSKFTEELWGAAKYIATLLENVGAEAKIFPTGPANGPIVWGKIVDERNKLRKNVPTVMLYSHYDVVCAGEGPGEIGSDSDSTISDDMSPLYGSPLIAARQISSSLWDSDPWDMIDVNGYYKGRGVSDNKGPLVAQILAIKELIDSEEPLPVNILFVCEGEEENGSANFHKFLEENSNALGAIQYAIFTNSYWLSDDQPCIVYGMRGVVDIQITISSGNETFGLHSGIHGGAVEEPLADLIAITAKLFDENGLVAVPGFYDDVEDVDSALNINNLTFDLEKYKEETKHVGLKSINSWRDLLRKRWVEPVLSITEVLSSTQSDADLRRNNFRILPSRVGCNISIRIVPNQDAEKLVDSVCKFIKSNFDSRKSPNTLKINVLRNHNWWQGNLKAALYNAAEDAIEKAWGVKPLLIREGGTIPIISLIQKYCNADTIQIPIGQASDNAHLPNECIRIMNLIKGSEIIKDTLIGLAQRINS